ARRAPAATGCRATATLHALPRLLADALLFELLPYPFHRAVDGREAQAHAQAEQNRLANLLGRGAGLVGTPGVGPRAALGPYRRVDRGVDQLLGLHVERTRLPNRRARRLEAVPHLRILPDDVLSLLVRRPRHACPPLLARTSSRCKPARLIMAALAGYSGWRLPASTPDGRSVI